MLMFRKWLSVSIFGAMCFGYNFGMVYCFVCTALAGFPSFGIATTMLYVVEAAISTVMFRVANYLVQLYIYREKYTSKGV